MQEEAQANALKSRHKERLRDLRSLSFTYISKRLLFFLHLLLMLLDQSQLDIVRHELVA